MTGLFDHIEEPPPPPAIEEKRKGKCGRCGGVRVMTRVVIGGCLERWVCCKCGIGYKDKDLRA
jgi:hypothetical protein